LAAQVLTTLSSHARGLGEANAHVRSAVSNRT
jgi:hypothetical protein